ncbi:MAG: ABC transporter ATP-binding protein, partial [Lachnospiraceae bacterium]|nr:ABC transporter ATP-binding protein [Lachnospiraceae bacterium]
MAELEVKGLKFRTGAKTIVDDVSFSVKDREMFVLCGPSGAGKTSILRLITGEWVPDSGEVLLSGENITKLPMQKRDTVLVSQSNNLFPHFTVRENAAFGLKARKIGGNEARER